MLEDPGERSPSCRTSAGWSGAKRRSKARAGSIPAASTSIRSDGPDFDEVRRPGWRDARDFESLRRQQVAPLVLGSLLAPDEDEHVEVHVLEKAGLGPGRHDAVDHEETSAVGNRAATVSEDRPAWSSF